MCGSGTSSHIIVCIWNLSGFLCNNPKCPGAQGPRPLCQSHLGGAVLNCAILAVAPSGIVLVCSVLTKHDRISWRVTRIRTLGKHHDQRPQGQSFLKGQYVETKATSLPCKRVLGKGSVQYYPKPLQEHIDLVTRIAKVMCFSHTWSSHCPSI